MATGHAAKRRRKVVPRSRVLPRHFPPGSVVINANENPMGPSLAALTAIATASSHRRTLRRQRPGRPPSPRQQPPSSTSPPTTSPSTPAPASRCNTPSWPSPHPPAATSQPTPPTSQAPGPPALMGAKISKALPLTPTYGHDMKAIPVAATPSAGLIYVCNPNNPTGTITPREDIGACGPPTIMPKGAILLVDDMPTSTSPTSNPSSGPRQGGQGRHRPANLLEGLRHGRHPLPASHDRPP